MISPIIFESDILLILSHCNKPVQLKTIKKVFDIVSISKEFKSDLSLNTSILKKLSSLSCRGFVGIKGECQHRSYTLTPLGFEYLSTLEIKDLVNEKIMEKVL